MKKIKMECNSNATLQEGFEKLLRINLRSQMI